MNLDKKQVFLRQYRVLHTKIQRLEEMIRECPEKAEEYGEKLRECRRQRDIIEASIDAVDGDILSEILSLKYICGRSLEEISLSLNYSKRHIERLHTRALEKIYVQNY